jgi:uncharacterized protein YyaL (SSP411 family)
MDGATPSGTSLAVELLLRVDRFMGKSERTEAALRALSREAGGMQRFPSAFGSLLSSLGSHFSPPVDVALLGRKADPAFQEMLRTVHGVYLPNRIVVGGEPDTLPAVPQLQGKTAQEGRATAFVCQGYACGPPLHRPHELREELESATNPEPDPSARPHPGGNSTKR